MSIAPSAEELKLICDGRFMVSRWRLLLTRPLRAISTAHDATCPFGFEITGDTTWLSRGLRRFYILLGGTFQTSSVDDFTRTYCERLLGAIQLSDPSFFDRIALARYNRKHDIPLKGTGYLANPTDVLINILALNDARGSLAVYADYLISFLSCLEEAVHGEFEYFHAHTRVRRRLCQLYLISGQLSDFLHLNTLFPPLPAEWGGLYSSEFQEFYSGQRASSPTDLELEILNDIIKPTLAAVRVEMHARAVETRPQAHHTYSVEDFYTGRQVRCLLASSDYDLLLKVVLDTYNSFGNSSSKLPD
jgi:hypothetical protein